MDKEFWDQKWQCNEIGFNQSQPNPLMQRYFASLGLQPGARILVPLCGKSIDMLWLAGQGYTVIGVEHNQLACKAFFQENKIPVRVTENPDFIEFSSHEITLFSGDFFKMDKNISGRINAVYDRAALIALPSAIRRKYAMHLGQLVEAESDVFLITTAYDQSQMQGPPFSVDEDEVNMLFQTHFDINQLYSSPFREIPAHLYARGLSNAMEQVYCLRRKRVS